MHHRNIETVFITTFELKTGESLEINEREFKFREKQFNLHIKEFFSYAYLIQFNPVSNISSNEIRCTRLIYP